jgi:peptidoglycan hydrolase CwlO-like protein
LEAFRKEFQARADDLKQREAALATANGQLQSDQADLLKKQQALDAAQKAVDDRAKALVTAQAAVVDARAKLAASDEAGSVAAQDALTKAETAFGKISA